MKRALVRGAKVLGAVLALLVVVLGAFVAWHWEPDRPVAALEARWAPPPSKFVELEGLRVHVRDEGQGKAAPIVLLHGTSASLHTWDGWADQLSGEHRVIRLDLPGFGLTGPPPDGDYRMSAYVRRVLGVLDALEVRRFILAGNSFGGAISIAIAHAHPTRVERLVLVDSAAYAVESSVSVPIGFRVARTPVLGRLAEVTLPRSVIESSLRNVYGDPSKVTPELVDRYFELTLRAGNRRAVVERFRQVPPGDVAALVPELEVPALILWGGQDRLIPLAYGQRLADEMRGSKLVVLDPLGHVPQEEDPAATLAAVRPFLRGE